MNLLDVLGDAVKNEDIVEGMEHDHEDHEHAEPDEHVWLSLRNAAAICRRLAAVLSEIDPENSGIYASNLAAYTDKLSALDKEYTDMENAASSKSMALITKSPRPS